ncbi:methyltransferase domain-containing protein [Asanoa sp. WMMD1127]|uniref:class I SAM-dependent methyltransferase n=1 Tax=Asanoa sp. WMMD1127 TaxID=3016107 RepID=UPI002417ABC6|nr:class I SAM-dependent methyltransferase [Asanoa sp. WMMD1127]MDG4827550.1 methyltransferase domain-containing protein [Asanoa sp. WMMD1127]
MTQSTEEFADRLFRSALGTAELLSVYLGDRLGWYQALADGGPADAAALVERAGGTPRYAREWLEQQASYGILTVTADGQFALPPGAAEVLTDAGSLNYLAPMARAFAAAAMQLPALVSAYRDGGGVGWATFGAEMREAQADANRPWFDRALPGALAEVEPLHSVLSRPGARIADVGCGAGWSSLALARAYPEALVDGFDVDAPSVATATANARAAGLADRVAFHEVDAGGGLPGAGDHDAAFAFECVHDLPRPVEVLSAVRAAVRPGAPVVVMDEAVGETFRAPGDDIERLMYGYSMLICLPDSMAHPESVGTGTVMRPDTLRGYARSAGFTDVEVLPIEGFGFFRFYLLTH